MQINPPYDGSDPCPMCQQDVRGVGALLHNAFVRWGEGKMFVKLNDLREFHPEPPTLVVPHPATEAMVELHRDIIGALEGMQREGVNITWTPQVRERIQALYERVRTVLIGIEPLSEAHFADDRHSSGRENILRRMRGSRGDLYHTGDGSTDYDYTVEVTAEAADLTHVVCGTGVRLHEHFKDNLRRDPLFYGRVWCPTCRADLPIAQFEQGSAAVAAAE